MLNINATWAELAFRPLVMGILNVTPDSFSDGGLHDDPITDGRAMLGAGADFIDIGGESTRPGAELVPPDVEIARVIPVITALAASGAIVSVDTRNAATMAAALDAGAAIVNDISGLRHDPSAAGLVAARRCKIILMHMRGTPMTMNRQARYTDVLTEVLAELTAVRNAALAAGISGDLIALDPGIGFAKTGAHNVALLRALPQFAALGHTLVVGVSRKRFIGDIAAEPLAANRDPGSLAAGLFALGQGAAILRVHNVPATVQALRVWHELTTPTPSCAEAP